ncbi:MAG TPA: Gfo/Idh/MocA family oxidoreductase [Candidatus Paceibacterota bacterium]|nr:Gfo/Idh/MocA family oxidoreductase [Candidatus Paceibacterota bacterium]
MSDSMVVNRRAFLKTSLAATAVLAMAGRGFGAPAAPVRLGIIGTGSRGTSLLGTLLRFPEARVQAVCDIVRERAERAAGLVRQRDGQAPDIYADTEGAWERLVERDDLEAVIIATPPSWHARMAVGAMRAGKYPGVEVPAAETLGECWELVRVSERTGIPCTMLENVCYFRNVMALLRMVRENVFGEILHCEAGYQHDCRALAFTPDGKLTWRGQRAAQTNGNPYPTHPIGPVAQWMNINRGDRFVALSSLSTPARGLQEYAAKKFGPDHELARRKYAQGDLNTTLLQTAHGRTVTLYHNVYSPRPYDLILRLQGTQGIYLGSLDSICLETAGKSADAWEPFQPYQEKYEHPVWKAMGAEALKSGGHGGAEYPMFHDFLHAVRTRSTPPLDVYDAATWSAIMPLSCSSVAKGGKLVRFPDFTGGRWKHRGPVPVLEPGATGPAPGRAV